MSRSPLYSPHHPFLLAVFAAAFTLLAAVVLMEVTGTAFRELGLGRVGAAIVVGGSLLGSLINIPISELKAKSELVEEYLWVFGKPYRIRRTDESENATIAVNVGGALIPSAVSLYLLSQHMSLLPQAIIGVAVVSIIGHIVARPVRGVGIVAPTFVTPLAAVAAALILRSDFPYVVAYVSGVLGTLIGADLTNLGSIQRIGGGVLSIGGAGTFDGVFLSGILAVLLA